MNKPREDTPKWARDLAYDLEPDAGEYYHYGYSADHIAEYCIEHAEEIFAAAVDCEPSLQNEVERLRAAVKRALAVEQSVTQGQERELRVGYVKILEAALAGEE